jgi:hypothetical protein
MVPIEMSVWRIDGDKAVPVERSSLANEALLETILKQDIDILGLPNTLLVVSDQVVTPYNGRIDLLCIDAEGTVYVVELKKGQTPREVVAQAMDYGYWVRDLGFEDIREIYEQRHPGGDFDDAFRTTLKVEPPETINADHRLVIVASALDAASERIVAYAQGFGLPVNVVFFQTFKENGAEYLTRTWLVDPVEEAPVRKGGQKKPQSPWNGQDWYVSFGEDEARNWEDAREYHYVSAGGGPWYSGTLKNLPIGGRVFVNIPGSGPDCGFVGVGIVTGTAIPVRDFTVRSPTGGPVPLTQVTRASCLAEIAERDDEQTEWIVPVSWVKTVPRSEAISFKGRYGNQNSATKLRHPLTRETVLERLGIAEEELDAAAQAAGPDAA